MIYRKIPDWMVKALYWICQPIMHSRKKPGPCRMPELCLYQSYIINKTHLILTKGPR